jgi:hypothetical protein
MPSTQCRWSVVARAQSMVVSGKLFSVRPLASRQMRVAGPIAYRRGGGISITKKLAVTCAVISTFGEQQVAGARPALYSRISATEETPSGTIPYPTPGTSGPWLLDQKPSLISWQHAVADQPRLCSRGGSSSASDCPASLTRGPR